MMVLHTDNFCRIQPKSMTFKKKKKRSNIFAITSHIIFVELILWELHIYKYFFKKKLLQPKIF